MISKTIHYCWFGEGDKPEMFYRCLKSWKKYCPDYEIVEWNENNYDISQNTYVYEAYKAKKWAFVTDYVRLWVIYNYGGVYLDTDVELVNNLDNLLSAPAFLGFEDDKNINTGLGFGAEKGNFIIKCMLKSYDKIHFQKKDGSYDLMTCPVRNTNAIEHLFPQDMDPNKVTKIEGAVLYPPEYFCPLDHYGVNLRKTKNTYSIHWFSATWLTDDEKVVHEYRIFRKKCEKLFGEKAGRYIAQVIYLFHPKKRKVLQRM